MGILELQREVRTKNQVSHEKASLIAHHTIGISKKAILSGGGASPPLFFLFIDLLSPLVSFVVYTDCTVLHKDIFRHV